MFNSPGGLTDEDDEEDVLTGDFEPQLDQLDQVERGLFENDDRLIIWRAGLICATKRGFVADEIAKKRLVSVNKCYDGKKRSQYDDVAILLGIQLPERLIDVPPQQLPPQLFTADLICHSTLQSQR